MQQYNMLNKSQSLKSLSQQAFGSITDWQMMQGAASNRIYYRFESAGQKIVCVDASHDPAAMSVWLQVHSLLKQYQIAVPETLHVDSKHHCYWINDLGHTHYRDNLNKTPIEAVTSLLTKLQQIPITQPLDQTYVEKCLHTFFTFVVKGLSIKHQDDYQNMNLHWLDEAYKRCPTGFCHTDFHSENIMLYESKLVLIDFQDACCRPLAYDWASWIYDFYHDFDESVRNSILSQHTPPAYQSNQQWQDDVYLCGLLRSLRVWGRFTQLSTVPGKTQYKQYIEIVKKRALYFTKKLKKAGDLKNWITDIS